MDDNTTNVLAGILLIFFILSVITASVLGARELRQIKYDNFQATIDSLSDEQKCLHICGFQWPSVSYLDNYKFCVEKCDRISERHMVINHD